jgi:hypothetical protein
MHRFTKLLVVGAPLAYVAARLARRTWAPAHTEFPAHQRSAAATAGHPAPTSGWAGMEPDNVGVSTEAVPEMGIADVDPVPLSHVAGEGFVPDTDEAAQHTVRDQRARLPQPGKNLI